MCVCVCVCLCVCVCVRVWARGQARTAARVSVWCTAAAQSAHTHAAHTTTAVLHPQGTGTNTDCKTCGYSPKYNFFVTVNNLCPECSPGDLDFAENGDGRCVRRL